MCLYRMHRPIRGGHVTEHVLSLKLKSTRSGFIEFRKRLYDCVFASSKLKLFTIIILYTLTKAPCCRNVCS